jgi:hypothetical protein
MVFSIQGCKTEEPVVEEEITETEEVEETAAEEEAEEEIAAEEETEEEAVEEEEEAENVKDLQITGNINMLNGMELSDDVKGGRPVAVMIENSPDSRPQSGLINADIVFEVVDEYGITRYVAVFSSVEAEIMGPVRSARIYYAEIARSFDPIYVFWGTYGDAYPVLIKNNGYGSYGCK